MAYRIIFRPGEKNSVSIACLTHKEEKDGYFQQFFMSKQAFATQQEAMEFLEQVPHEKIPKGIVKEAIYKYLRDNMKVSPESYHLCLDD